MHCKHSKAVSEGNLVSSGTAASKDAHKLGIMSAGFTMARRMQDWHKRALLVFFPRRPPHEKRQATWRTMFVTVVSSLQAWPYELPMGPNLQQALTGSQIKSMPLRRATTDSACQRVDLRPEEQCHFMKLIFSLSAPRKRGVLVWTLRQGPGWLNGLWPSDGAHPEQPYGSISLENFGKQLSKKPWLCRDFIEGSSGWFDKGAWCLDSSFAIASSCPVLVPGFMPLGKHQLPRHDRFLNYGLRDSAT